MCQNYRVIARVKNGELSVCKDCKNYNLVLNNIYFQFDKNQLLKFREYVLNIDTEYWLDHNSETTKKRKIPIPTAHQNLILIFNVYELEALKVLLGISTKVEKAVLTASDIDYNLILN